jgi:predicted small lipoprotein YifL
MARPYGFLAALLAGLLTCGCGQKGPLFLPGERDIQTELPKMDREALEDALGDELDDPDDKVEDDENRSPEVPEAVRPEDGDDEAEPFIDPASPPADRDDP